MFSRSPDLRNLRAGSWFFKMVFPLVRRTMSPKLRSRVRVLSNYGELTDEIDAEQLLPEVRLMFIYL